MIISEHLIEHKRARGECYKLLAALFYQPDKNLYREEGLFENLNCFLKLACPDALSFSGRMEQSISQYSDEELLVDYAKLFVGPYELIAPPYGSVYLEDGRRLMGDTTLEVLNMYRLEGLAMDEDFKEMPDHIAVELEFMYYLIVREIEALQKSDFKSAMEFLDKQEMFLNTFLRRWVPAFCERIKEGTENKFYTALSDCLSKFISV